MSKKVIKGFIDLRALYLDKLPDFLRSVEVEGFDCSNNELTSLEGAPLMVNGSFFCSDNHLTTLEGAPQFVGVNFWCINNTVQFTEEQVRAVCEVGGKVYV